MDLNIDNENDLLRLKKIIRILLEEIDNLLDENAFLKKK